MKRALGIPGVSRAIALLTGAAGIAFVLSAASKEVAAGDPVRAVNTSIDEPRYVGSQKCKNCHDKESTGDPHGIWSKGPHARAFATLSSDEALAHAHEKGIEDPSKSDQCLVCHVTGHGLPKERFQRGFKAEEGVGCESCHGPGETHFKARMKDAARGVVPDGLPEGEIVSRPPLETCLGCHDEKSPTFRPFCYRSRWSLIEHLDPRKGRSAEEIEAMKCTCGEECGCTKGECGAPWEEKGP